MKERQPAQCDAGTVTAQNSGGGTKWKKCWGVFFFAPPLGVKGCRPSSLRLPIPLGVGCLRPRPSGDLTRIAMVNQLLSPRRSYCAVICFLRAGTSSLRLERTRRQLHCLSSFAIGGQATQRFSSVTSSRKIPNVLGFVFAICIYRADDAILSGSSKNYPLLQLPSPTKRGTQALLPHTAGDRARGCKRRKVGVSALHLPI
jgi:hypothetical protein